MRDDTAAPSVLFVCRANLCRSPLAEHLFRARPAVAGWTVGSAGIQARAGQPMHPLAHAVLTEADLDPTAFRSRPVTAALLRASDLVLTASQAQLDHVLMLEPTALRRSSVLGTLARQLAHVDDGSTATDPAGLLALARQVRPRVEPAPPGADDLADPIGGGLGDFRRCALRLEELFDVLTARLAAPTPA